MFHKKSRRLQRQASFSGVASKLMDATSEKSRKLSRQINKMARVQEEKDLQERREQEEAAQQEKKKKEEGFARSIITRKLSIFGSYRRMSFSTRKPVIIVEVSNHPPFPPTQTRAAIHNLKALFTDQFVFREIFSANFDFQIRLSHGLIVFTFSFGHYRTMDAHTYVLPVFAGESTPKRCYKYVKINWPVKTSLRLSMRVARTGLLAKTDYHLGEIRTSRGACGGITQGV